jgi:CRISPR/Cas system CSM-associated protein Csm4 (group 5 of RAMP superfamily)
MNREITSKKTNKSQIIDEETWQNIVARGWDKKYTVVEMPEKKLKEVPVINKPIELVKKEIKLKNKKDGQKN